MGATKVARKKELDEIADMLGKNVVVDTTTPLIYIGRLTEIGDYFITLEDVDVHDSNESPASKEVYCIDAKKYGIKKNRRRVRIVRSIVASISLLEDVIEY